MKSTMLRLVSIVFVAVSALSVLYVSILAFIDPQQVMDLVQVQLNNTDAYSSIRGVYGGVGLTIVAMLLILSNKHLLQALTMLSFLWGMYSLSRLITIYSEGPLHAFGKQWLMVETVLFVIALVLVRANMPIKKAGS